MTLIDTNSNPISIENSGGSGMEILNKCRTMSNLNYLCRKDTKPQSVDRIGIKTKG